MDGLSPVGSSDADLVRSYQNDPEGAGGRAAAAALFSRYHERLYSWCFRQVRNHQGAMDLAQDTSLAALRALKGFEGRAEFSSWLFSIARNRHLSALRSSRRTPAAEMIDPDELAVGGPDPAEWLELLEDEERVLESIRSALDPHEQTALWLRCFEGKPIEEIGRLLCLENVSGARALLQRARRKLRTAIAARSR